MQTPESAALIGGALAKQVDETGQFGPTDRLTVDFPRPVMSTCVALEGSKTGVAIYLLRRRNKR